MIHYHGTPCGATRDDVARFLKGRHALIPFFRPEDIGTAAEVCQSFCIDNGAFSAWKKGISIDWERYYKFFTEWRRHPSFDWAIIPDVIDGDDEQNDALIGEWKGRFGVSDGVPVWHMHESYDRLERLCNEWPRVALGSSGQFAKVGTKPWWKQMAGALDVVCVGGKPIAKLHGLRMLSPKVFTKMPLASADSTNAVRNSSSFKRFGIYIPPNASTRMTIIAERIESQQSASAWHSPFRQLDLFTEGDSTT